MIAEVRSPQARRGFWRRRRAIRGADVYVRAGRRLGGELNADTMPRVR